MVGCIRPECHMGRTNPGMKRRKFLSLISAAVMTWPLEARGQSSADVRRVAVVMPYADDPIAEARLSLFRQGLHQHGWTDGQNVKIEYYFANSDLGRMRSYAT